MTMQEILTEQEVASLLDCEETTVQRKARNKELPAIKLGRTWVFPREALLRVLNDRALNHTLQAPKPARPAAVAIPIAGTGTAAKSTRRRPDLTALVGAAGSA